MLLILPHHQNFNKLFAIHKQYAQVFNDDLSESYNGHSGDHDVDWEFKGGIPPPVTKQHVPNYVTHADKVLTQAMIDKLEQQGIVAKASSLQIIPRFAAPCMCVKKGPARVTRVTGVTERQE